MRAKKPLALLAALPALSAIMSERPPSTRTTLRRSRQRAFCQCDPKDINIVTKFVKQADKLEKAGKALNAAGDFGSALQAASVIQEGIRLKDAFDRVNQEYGERIANAWKTYNILFREAGIAYKNKRWTEIDLRRFLIKIRHNLEMELLHAGFDREPMPG